MRLNAVFGCTKTPFSIDPPEKSDQIMKTQQLDYLVERFKNFLDTKGLFLFTGESGCGKTTTINYLLSLINPHQFKAIYLNNYPTQPRSFLKFLIQALDYQPQSSIDKLIVQFTDVCSELHAKSKQTPIFILDEAQNLSDAVLEQIRLLITFHPKTAPIFIFIAHPIFKNKLKLACYEPLRQRLTLHFSLSPLTKNEINDYIAFQLNHAGVQIPLFSDDAVTQIFNHSKGIPRLINKICIESLIKASFQNLKSVDQHLVDLVVNLDSF